MMGKKKAENPHGGEFHYLEDGGFQPRQQSSIQAHQFYNYGYSENEEISRSRNKIDSADFHRRKARINNRQEAKQYYNDSPVVKKRKCRDVLFLGFFTASCLVMIIVMAYAAFEGDLRRFINGVDNDCDICGIKNKVHQNIVHSGKDLRTFMYFVTARSNHGSELISSRTTSSHDLVFKFPEDENDISNNFQNRARLLESVMVGECLQQCPTNFRVILNRCIQYGSSSTKNSSFTSNVTSNSIIQIHEAIERTDAFFEEARQDLQNSFQEIGWMCLISFGVAVGMTVLLRVFAGVIIWLLVTVIVLTGIGGTTALWFFWLAKQNDPGDWNPSQVTGLLAVTIVATIITFIVLLILLFLRKRIALVIRLFNEAGKALHALPLLIFQPAITFFVLAIGLGIWGTIGILIESSGNPKSDINGCHYEKKCFTLFSRWWNIFMITWFIQFIFSCQHFIIASAVSIWFFSRDKRHIGFPIIRSYSNLFNYHLGTIAFGSLIISIVKIIRYILVQVQKRINNKNSCCRAILCFCQSCLACLDKFLIFLNRNAYVEVGIYGYGFCKSARKAFNIIVNNALRLSAINYIGDFVLFLAKISIVSVTVFIGYEIIKSKENEILYHIWIPLVIGGIISFGIAHCFISVYEMIIDAVFICFCEDKAMNDGLEKPYFMSKGLMEFVKFSKMVDKTEQRRRK